jgi:hypothetical protein
MGGVDLMDQRCKYYEYPHKNTKWYKMVAHHLMELSINNAYICHTIYCKNNHMKPLSSQHFRMGLMEQLVRPQQLRKNLMRPPLAPLPIVAPETRTKGQHFLTKKTNAQGRNLRWDCVVCSDRLAKKRKQTVFVCTVCQKAMCPEKCFQLYHTKRFPKI